MPLPRNPADAEPAPPATTHLPQVTNRDKG